jgi:hypothetical protein
VLHHAMGLNKGVADQVEGRRAVFEGIICLGRTVAQCSRAQLLTATETGGSKMSLLDESTT